MTESEVAEIIERHTSKSYYYAAPSPAAKAAAREIFSGIAAKTSALAVSNPVYVKPSCDCGAQRVKPTAKHAQWCSLLRPARRY